MLAEKLNTLKKKYEELRARYEKFLPAVFFVAGFLFDVITLTRIDDWITIAQQGTYLLIIIQILKYKTLEQAGVWTPHPRLGKYWHYSTEVMHFFLGTLLNFDSLFYLKSSSLATSILFLVVMFTVLIVNELPQFKNKGLQLKFALLSICLFSFFFIIVPTTLGRVGALPVFISIALGLLIVFTIYSTLKARKIERIDLKKTILLPPIITATLLLVLYFLKILPPIPLSIERIGIYHQIEKVKITAPAGEIRSEFHLKYSRPAWMFWQNGAQDFNAQPGDKIFCFVRIFAPTNFSDQIIFHWLKKTSAGWVSQDHIASSITGGREEGFRTYAFKSNFEPGLWRVQVETTDSREIGRIAFEVENVETNPDRLFREDKD